MLINCEECNEEISDKAISCPNCGCPVEDHAQMVQLRQEQLICPEFPDDLSLGESKKTSPNTLINCDFNRDENVFEKFSNGMVYIQMHKNGINLRGWGKNNLSIHNSQIISLNQITGAEIIKDKSVIGRAIVGSLFGGAGLIVGALSGVGSKRIRTDKNYLIINFWDLGTKEPNVIVLSNKHDMRNFINKFNREIID